MSYNPYGNQYGQSNLYGQQQPHMTYVQQPNAGQAYYSQQQQPQVVYVQTAVPTASSTQVVIDQSPNGYNNGSSMQSAQQYFESDKPNQLVSDMDVQVRHGFLLKVLGILAVQLFVTFGIVLAFTFIDSFNEMARNNVGLYYGSFAFFFGFLIVISCCPDFTRKHPNGLIVLAGLTIAMSLMMGVLAANRAKETVLTAIAGTAAIVAVLTLFACQTKYDFTKYYPYLVVVLLVFVIFGFALLFFKETSTVRLVYAIIGILIFSCFLVFDLQMVIGGKHKKYEFDVDDYVFAATNIYLDIVYIFMYMMSAIDNS